MPGRGATSDGGGVNEATNRVDRVAKMTRMVFSWNCRRPRVVVVVVVLRNKQPREDLVC